MKKVIVFFYSLLLLASCANENQEYNTRLDEIFHEASENENLNCLIVYKDDQIVKESYFNNTDPNTPHDVRSVTKSIMATLIGIAIDNGIITSEHEPIGNYLTPSLGSIDPDKSELEIYNILTMTAGIAGAELLNPYEYLDWFNSDNQMKYTLSKPMVSQPGVEFNYNSGVAHLLSGILMQAANNSVRDFAEEFLFQKLEIDLSDHIWETDKQGIINGAAGLQLTPYDLLKIGQLYLNKGMYNGSRIVSENWIEKATSRQVITDNAQPYGPSYGYLWWVGEASNHDYYFANGYGGQFLVIVPDICLIVVATNEWRQIDTDTANTQWYSTLELIMEQILSLY